MELPAIGFPFLALLGGYVFVTNCNLTAFWCAQSTDHRLYFTSAIAAAVLVAIARLILIAPPSELATILDAFSPICFVVAGIALVAGTVGHIVDRFDDVLALGTSWTGRIGLAGIGFFLVTIGIGVLFLGRTMNVTTGTTLAGGTWVTVAIGALTYLMRVPWKAPTATWFTVSFRLGLTLTMVLAGAWAGVSVAEFLGANWSKFSTIPASGMFTIAAFLGAVAWVPLNTFYPRDYAKWHAIQRNAEDILEGFLWLASQRASLVQINLNNGKVYVGYVVKTPASLQGPDNYLRFLPMLSGHRATETHKLTLNIFYHRVYRRFLGRDLKPEDLGNIEQLQKVISADEIWSASFFDPNLKRGFDADVEKESEVRRTFKRKRPRS